MERASGAKPFYLIIRLLPDCEVRSRTAELSACTAERFYQPKRQLFIDLRTEADCPLPAQNLPLAFKQIVMNE
jgi:hypothetical protein